ncbi:hypothetical protein ABK040_003302 [Willaertia magna]
MQTPPSLVYLPPPNYQNNTNTVEEVQPMELQDSTIVLYGESTSKERVVLEMVNRQEMMGVDHVAEKDVIKANTVETVNKKKKKKLKKVVKKVKDFLDVYGESVDGPTIRKKSYMGAFLSTLFRLVALVLIGYNLYLLIIQNRTQVEGDVVTLNYIKASDNHFLDVPTIQLTVKNNITFYEKFTGPSLQRIDIRDKFGYEKILSTRTSKNEKPLPIAKAIYGKHNVKMNSINPLILRPFSPSSMEKDANSSYNVFSSELNSMSEYISNVDDTLKLHYIMNGVFDSSTNSYFVNHSVHLFVRFLDDMSHIKPCQLQIGMLNAAELSLITDLGPNDRYHIKTELQSHTDVNFVTMKSTWNISTISDSYGDLISSGLNFNLLTLHSEYNSNMMNEFLSKTSIGGLSRNITQIAKKKGITEQNFNNWAFFINYVNNMLFTHSSIICDKSEDTITDMSQLFYSNSRKMSANFPLDLNIIQPTAEDTQFIVRIPQSFDMYKQIPFYMIAVGVTGVTTEAIYVKSIRVSNSHGSVPFTYAKYTVSRENPINYAKVEPMDDTFTKHVLNYQRMVNPPATVPKYWIDNGWWNCNAAKYNDGYCDCGCGFVNSTVIVRDIDCDNIMYNIFNGDRLLTNYTKMSCSISGTFCSQQDTCIEPPFIKGSKGCYNRAVVIGDTEHVGFYGSPQDHQVLNSVCKQCPGDSLYNERAILSVNRDKYVCKANPTGYIFGRDFFIAQQSSSSMVVPWQGAPKGFSQNCLTIPIRIKVAEPFFPTLQTGEYYKIIIGDSSNSQYLQTAYLVNVGNTTRTTKTLTPEGSLKGMSQYDVQQVCITKQSNLDFLEMAGFGKLLTSISPYSSMLVVDPDTFTSPFSEVNKFIGRFPTKGEFKAAFYTSDGGDGLFDTNSKEIITLNVVSVSDIGAKQILFLKAPPNFAIGQVFSIKSFALGRTKVTVEVENIGTDRSSSNLVSDFNKWKKNPSSSKSIKILLRKSYASYASLEYLTLTDLVYNNPNYDFTFTTSIQGEYNEGCILEYVSDMKIGSILLPLTISAEYSRTEFKPSLSNSKSYSSASPDSFGIEYALFIVPDKKPLPQQSIEKYDKNVDINYLNLCPKEYLYEEQEILNKQDPIWKGYSVKAERKHKVSDCSLVKWNTSMIQSCINVKNHEKNQFNNHCIKQMPPSYSLLYSHVWQINNKWENISFLTNDLITNANTPEYVINFEHEYYFQHDGTMDEIDSKFSGNMKTTGDINQNGDTLFFNGKLYYMGASADPSIPANSPILKTEVTLDVSPFVVNDILNNKDALMDNFYFNTIRTSGTYRNMNSLKPADIKAFVKDKLKDVTIQWDIAALPKGNLNGQIILSPGYKYTLYATLKISTVYTTGSFGNTDIDNIFISVVSSSVTTQKLDYIDRNKCIVNYQITIDLPQSKQVILSVDYTFLSFLTDLSASFGVLSIGLTLLEYWQIFKTPKIYLHDALKEDKEKSTSKLKKSTKVQNLN